MTVSRKDEDAGEKSRKKKIRKMTVRIESGNGKEQMITKVIKKEIKNVSN